LLKEGFLLPPGEGQEEGIYIKKKLLVDLIPSPQPSPCGRGG